jgi:adenylate cyclase
MVRPKPAMPRANWRRTTFYHQLENGLDELVIDLGDCDHLNFNLIKDVSAQGPQAYRFLRQSIRRGRLDGLMDCFYSYWTTRRAEGFGAEALAALRDLVPCWGLAIKSAAQMDVARTLGRVYLGRDASEQVLRGRHRPRHHRAHQRGAVVFRSARLDRDQREYRTWRHHPVPQ